MFRFNKKIGIGGKLFLAFGLTLTLIAAVAIFGWFGFGRVAVKQGEVIDRAIPAMAQAQQLAAISASMNALAPILAATVSEQRHATLQATIEEQKARLNVILKGVEQHGFNAATTQALKKTVGRITDNLSQQSNLVKQRIEVEKKRDSVIFNLLNAGKNITELSGSLVANAASSTTAVTSSLYELLATPAESSAAYVALDRLVEVDIDAMERMFELRLSSAKINALVTQLSKETELSKITLLHAEYLKLLKIITRRISEIDDPTRQRQAKELLTALEVNSDIENSETVFTLQRKSLRISAALEQLHTKGLEEAASLNAIVGDLIKEGSNIINQSTSHVQDAVDAGRNTSVVMAIFSLIFISSFLWLYLQKKVVRRLIQLKTAMGELATGNYAIEVEKDGHDELSLMADTIEVFKQNAIAKERLEKQQEETEKELRRRKANLEKDIAERTKQLRKANKDLQQEAREHDKARDIAVKANRAKTEFFATMSHELRTPMSGILGTVNLLADTDLTPQQKKYTDTVSSAGQGLLEILNDLLEQSKIEGGKLELQHVNFSLQQLLASMTSLMQATIEKKGIRLLVKIDPSAPNYLIGDPGKLRQILLNLIGNASKFTQQGHIRVSVHEERRTATHARLLFAVTDTGIGIAEQSQKDIFDPFTQVDSSISRQYGGLGLGLAICQRFVSAMGGEINCDSEKGVGTTISFALQFLLGEESHVAESEASHGYEKFLAGLNVLLVEDNEVNCMVATTYLEKTGCNVAVAVDGFQAVEMVSDGDYDLVLMDISLPGKDGVQATQEIRRLDGERSRIPIIAMSAHVFKEEVREYLDAGMDGFLGKPIDPASVNSVLYQVLCKQSKAVSLPVKNKEMIQETSCRAALLEDVEHIGFQKTRQLVKLFFDTTPQIITQLEKNIVSNDNVAIGNSAHKLRGAASTIGLDDLHGCALDIETSARDHADDLQPLFDHLQCVYQDSCQMLKRIIEDISHQAHDTQAKLQARKIMS